MGTIDTMQTEPAVRRVFICYTRRSLTEVEQFDRALLERLRTLSNRYEVFRDKSPRPTERINTGDHYPTTLLDKLDSSVCCLVVLVPSIFESVECEKEVLHFAGRIERGEPGFFFPVAFGKVDREFDAPAPGHNAIGRTLKEIDRTDFSGFWHLRDDDPLYRRKVAELADAIHLKVQELFGENPPRPEPAAGTGSQEDGGTPPPPPRRRRLLVAAAALVAIAAALLPQGGGGWTSISRWLGPAPVDWQPVSRPVEVVAPVPLYDTPQSPEPSGMLSPAELGADTRFEEASIDGLSWYRITMPQRAGFARADDIPAWHAVDGPLELVMPTPVYAAPWTGEAPASSAAVGPGSYAAGAAGVERVARAAYREAPWLRIDRAGRPSDFLRQADIPHWTTLLEGAIGLIDQAKALSRPVTDAAATDVAATTLFPDAPISSVRRAQVSGSGWYRLSHGTTSHFLPADAPVDQLFARWTDRPGLCLKGGPEGGWTYSRPRADPSRQLRPFRRGIALTRGQPVQAAEVAAAVWYRYRDDGALHHVPGASVVECNDAPRQAPPADR